MSDNRPAAKVIIKRKHTRANRAAPYRLMLDGYHAADVVDDGTTELTVTPGHHELYLQIDWCRSPTVSLDVHPDENVELECRADSNPVTALYMLTFGRKRYIDFRILRRWYPNNN